MNQAALNDAMHALSVWVVPLILSITLHEAAHGFAAWRLGDDTAMRMGRVSFNPIRHVDPFGTLLLPALMLMSGASFLFGWAKPVPVNFMRLRHLRRDMVLVALAGPGINIVLAVVSALLLYPADYLHGPLNAWVSENLGNSLIINVVLAVFNMLPILPLDGGRVLFGVLPRALARPYARTERWGLLIVLVAALVLPQLGRALGVDLDVFRWAVQVPASYVIQFIVHVTGIG